MILDNCEHVIGAAAVLARALVVGGPLVRVLTTSREPLRVQDEYVYRVPSLDVPAEDSVDGDDLSRHGAVRFTEGFDTTDLVEAKALLKTMRAL